MEAAREQRQTKAVGPWRRLGQAVLSALLPGAGQFVGGARARGLVLVAAALLMAAVAGILLVVAGVDSTIAWAIAPSALLVLIALDAVVLAFRLFAVIDAFQTPRRLPGTRPPDYVGSRVALRIAERRCRLSFAVGFLLALLLLLTAGPHVATGYYLYVSHDLMTAVFSDGDKPVVSTDASPDTSNAAPATGPSSSGAAGATTTNAGSIGSGSTSSPPSTYVVTTSSSGGSSISLTTTETEEELPVRDDDGRLTVLLVGTDAGYGRSGARADSIMVATADLSTGRVALFGIARNTGSVPLSEAAAKALGTKTYLNLISSLYSDALEHPELAPEGQDPGAVVLRDTVSMLLGIPIDYYAVVDMGGFVKVVDALGGVTLNVKERVQVRLSPPTPDQEWRVYDIEPGIRHLSGLEALAFARSRTGSSDYVRMGRQRCILAALLYQNGAAEFLLKFPKLAQVIKESVKTDLPLETLQALIKARSRLRADQTITVGFTRPKYTKGVNSMGYNILDVELVQRTVRQIIEHPEEVTAEEEGEQSLDTYDCWKVK